MAPLGTVTGSSVDRPARRLDRRGAWWMLAVSTGILLALAVVLVPWDWLPGSRLVTPRAEDVFSAQEISRAESYAARARLLSYSSYAVSLTIALAFGVTPLGAGLARRVGAWPWVRRLRGWATVPVVVLCLLLAGRLAALPFSLALRERRVAEGLTTQGLAPWFGDRALSLLVSWVMTALLVLLVVAAARRWPRRWYVPAGALAMVLVFAGSYLYPVVVEPLFNRFTPLRDDALEQAVFALADAEGVHVDEVLVADASRRTTTLNAYVSGLGDTRRVVLYDTLLHQAAPAEIEAVVAHELAHAEHGDVLLGTGLGALGAVVGVCALALVLDTRRVQRRAGVAGAADPAATALVMALFAIGGLLTGPVQNTVSRAIEARADRTALEATADPRSFAAMQLRLARRSLADPTPPTVAHVWFGSHPTVLQRLGLAAAAEAPRR